MADAKAAESSKPPTKKELQAQLAELEIKLKKAHKARDEEMGKDWRAYAQDVTDKFFGGYQKVESFLGRCVEQIERRYWVISPFGRRRTMYRVLTGANKFVADAGRRAKNSPIQGLSSEVGVTAGYLVVKEIDKYMRHWGMDYKHFTLYCRAVHDASYFEESFPMLIPAIHINQHVATVGVTEYYAEVFNFRFILQPEINISFGADDNENSFEWDWDLEELPKLIRKSLDALVQKKQLDASKVDRVMEIILEPWINKEKRQWLQANYPLLGVSKLDKQICHALKANGYEPEV